MAWAEDPGNRRFSYARDSLGRMGYKISGAKVACA